PQNPPSGRRQTSLLYDAASNRVTIFGGQAVGGTPALNETWVLTWAASRIPGVAFANPNAPVTTAGFGAPGAYTLRLAGGGCAVSVLFPNGAPQVDAGSAITVTLPASASLAGRESDDGLPLGSTLSTTWSQVSGPGAVSFGNANALATTASFSTAGSYVLRLTV